MRTQLKVLKPQGELDQAGRPRGLAEIIAIANQKGGVGKTTTATNVAAALAERGFRVLLIDLDPQSSLSISLGIAVHELQRTVYDALLETEPNITLAQVIRDTHYPNVKIAPSNIDLSKAEMELMSEMNRERALATALERVSSEYDYILIDCPPSLGLLTTNALAAAHRVLIPTQADYLAVRGAGLLINTIQKVQKKLNPRLEVAGILITMFDKRTLHAKEILEELRTTYNGKVFTSIIGQSVKVKEAPIQGEALLSYDSSNPISESYRSLAEEITGHVQTTS